MIKLDLDVTSNSADSTTVNTDNLSKPSIVIFSPSCSGCVFQEATDTIKEFCKLNDVEFVARQSTIAANYSYMKTLGLVKLVQQTFLYCPETRKMHFLRNNETLEIKQLEELLS